jgi:hypothetical protein
LIPVYLHRVELEACEPLLLQLELQPGEWQVQPASLGYFLGDPASGLRQFFFAAEVPRGLIYRWIPAEQLGVSARNQDGDLGRVEVIEIETPANAPLYFEKQLEEIRLRVVELNRQKNLLLQSRQQLASASRSNYSSALDRLWSQLQVHPNELDDGGWSAQMVSRYPAETAKIIAQLSYDAKARGEQKQLYYSTQHARIRLMLSQFDLQFGLARLPRPRNEQLLSMGNTALVKETVLAEIDRLSRAWEQRQAELQREIDGLKLNFPRWSVVTPDSAPGFGSFDLAGSGGGFPAGAPPSNAQQSLYEAVVLAWLFVQQQELDAVQASLPQLAAAREHVSGRRAPDWSSLPRRSVNIGQMRELELEALSHYAVLDSGMTITEAVSMLAGLARQFETKADGNTERHALSIESTDSTLRQQSALDGLREGSVDASPHELAYGLLVVERSRTGIGSHAGSGAGMFPSSLNIDNAQLSLRAGLAGEIDQILQNPDSWGLAAFDLSLLKFIRWYCALGLPAEAPAVSSATSTLHTESYGFISADQTP